MATVKFENASRIYPGRHVPSVDRLNINITDGEFLVLLGPAGSGKSTSLRMLAGLEEVDSGDIWIGDFNVKDLSPRDNEVAMIFQNYALYPHMSVADNMGFALKIAGINRSEITTRVVAAAKVLDLMSYLDQTPEKLSGAQRQRVAMGRAIVRQPQVFLMDEPLLDLDADLRVQTRTHIASLQRKLGVTMVYVAHDQVEAMAMGDRVAVLKEGVLQQCDTPTRMYDHPGNVFVAGFIGSQPMNLLTVPIVSGGMQFGSGTHAIERSLLAGVGTEAILGVRPEDLTINVHDEGVPITVTTVRKVGAETFIHGSTLRRSTACVSAVDPPGNVTPIIVRLEGGPPPKRGSVVHVSPKPGHVHAFHSKTGLRIGD